MNDELSMDDIYNDLPEDSPTQEAAQPEGGAGPQDDGADPYAGADPEADALYDGTVNEGRGDDDGGEPLGYEAQGTSDGDGLYQSVARALMEDGILHTDDVSGVTDADALRGMIEAEVRGRMTPLQQRVDMALNYGMRPDEIQQYESAISEAEGYTDESIRDESEDGAERRRSLIYYGCMARGMSEAQAEREVSKSFKAGTDVEDAIDARDTVLASLREQYDGAMEERAEAQRRAMAGREGFNRALYDSVAGDDGRMVGDMTENTKRMVLGNLFDRCVPMGDGRMGTPIEAAAAADPVGFQKALGVAFTLTDGFRDFDRLAGVKAGRAVKKGIEGLERALRGGGQGGALRYANGSRGGGGDDDYEILG